jgi:hypothetical protein
MLMRHLATRLEHRHLRGQDRCVAIGDLGRIRAAGGQPLVDDRLGQTHRWSRTAPQRRRQRLRPRPISRPHEGRIQDDRAATRQPP